MGRNQLADTLSKPNPVAGPITVSWNRQQIGFIRKSVIVSNIRIEVNKFTHFGSRFETVHNVSASQLEVLVTGCFRSWNCPGSRQPQRTKRKVKEVIYIKKNAPSMSRKQGYQLPPDLSTAPASWAFPANENIM